MNRISPYETTVLALEATLIEYRQERSFGDSDYRVVLADESGRTIIAKIPSPDCAAQESGEPGSELPESRFLAGIEFSRAEFAARLSPTTTVKRASIRIRVMGIGMFDSLSGQTGEAPTASNFVQSWISPSLKRGCLSSTCRYRVTHTAEVGGETRQRVNRASVYCWANTRTHD